MSAAVVCPREGSLGMRRVRVCAPPGRGAAAGHVPEAGVTCEDVQGAAAARGHTRILGHGASWTAGACLRRRTQQRGFLPQRPRQKTAACGCCWERASSPPWCKHPGHASSLATERPPSPRSARGRGHAGVPPSVLGAPPPATAKPGCPPARCPSRPAEGRWGALAVQSPMELPALGARLRQTGISECRLRVMSRYVALCHVMSRYVALCRVMSWYVVLCRVMSCYVVLCHIMSCYVVLCHVMSCYATLCHVMSYYVALCHVMMSRHDSNGNLTARGNPARKGPHACSSSRPPIPHRAPLRLPRERSGVWEMRCEMMKCWVVRRKKEAKE